MTLIPYDPFKQLENWRREMDRFFTEAVPSAMTQTFGGPRIDVYETNDEVVVACEIPGLENKEDVNIDLNENVLTLSGSVNRSKEVKEEFMHRKERYVGRFQRSVSLPSTVKSEGAKASYKNGILEIRMPKQETKQRKKIDIDFH